MKRLLLVFATLLALCTASLALPLTVAAFDPFGSVECGQASDSAVCQDKSNTENPLTGIDGLILKIVNIIAVVAGATAVIIIIVSGFRFVTSGGSSDEVAGARRSLIYALVGLAIIALSRTIIAFILGKI